MPLHHLVMFNLKEDGNAAAIAEISSLLHSCGSLPGCNGLSFGRQDPTMYDGYMDRSNGYNYGIYATFEVTSSARRAGSWKKSASGS